MRAPESNASLFTTEASIRERITFLRKFAEDYREDISWWFSHRHLFDTKPEAPRQFVADFTRTVRRYEREILLLAYKLLDS